MVEIAFTDGWNLISPPRELNRSDLERQGCKLAPIERYGSYFLAYDAARQQFVETDTLSPGNGYAMYCLASANVSFEPATGLITTEFHQGWNLIGFPIRVTRTMFNQSSITFDAPETYGQPFLTLSSTAHRYRGTTTIEPGIGYWAYTPRAGEYSSLIPEERLEVQPDPFMLDIRPIAANSYNAVLTVIIRFNELTGVMNQNVGNVEPLKFDALGADNFIKVIQPIHSQDNLIPLEGTVAIQILETIGGPIIDVLTLPIDAYNLMKDLMELMDKHDGEGGPKRAEIDVTESGVGQTLRYLVWIHSENEIHNWAGSPDEPVAYNVHYTYRPSTEKSQQDSITVSSSESIPANTL